MITEIHSDKDLDQEVNVAKMMNSSAKMGKEVASGPKYSFTMFEAAKFIGFDHKDIQALLFKWYLIYLDVLFDVHNLEGNRAHQL